MKVAIVINGTRGDVEPMLALTDSMIRKGHEIIFCAPSENQELIRHFNCRFVAFGPDYRKLFKQKKIKGGPTAAPSPKEMKEETERQIDLLPDILKGSDLILGVGFVLGLHTVADTLKIPYRFVVFYPVLLGPGKSDPILNRLLFHFGRSMTNAVMKNFINKKRAAVGLPVINDVWANWMGEQVIVACDRELNPACNDVSFKFIQTAYMLLDHKNVLPEQTEQFLNAGKPPVFIGFGSNPISEPEKYNEIFEEVSSKTGQRLIISKGWADLPAKNTGDILYVDEIPFELLFPRMNVIVHHGGSGTMAAAARGGIPQIAFPFMADQFENRKQIVKLGLGPKTCDFKKLSAKALSEAITDCINDGRYKKNAIEISQKLRNINGVDMTLKILEKEFEDSRVTECMS